MAGAEKARSRDASPSETAVKKVVSTADVQVAEYAMEPGEHHPWHYHSHVTDRFYCLEGLVAVETRASLGKVVLKPGEQFSVPPGVVHHAGNGGATRARYLLVQALGPYDFIRAD